MKKNFLILFLFVVSINFSQKKISKKFKTTASEIYIYTTGLDDIVLENSNSKFIEVFLYAENYDSQLIKIENNNNEANIKFAFEGAETREVIFRKYITKRLQRANAIVKIPKGKKVFVFGENVDIESKNLKSELAVYIENGIIKLNEMQANTILKLYSGNVYANLKNTNIDITSNTGNIKVDDNNYQKNYQISLDENLHKLKITSIKANILLTTE